MAALLVFFLGTVLGRNTSPNVVTTAAQPSVVRQENGTETTSLGTGPTTWLTNIAVNYPVGVGYSHDAAGALAAGEHYTAYLSGQAMLGQPYRNSLLAVVVAASKQSGLGQLYDTAMTTDNNPLVKLTTSGTPVVTRTATLGQRVNSITSEAAQVSLWVVNVSGAVTGLAPTTSYQTVTLDLVWENNDWKVSGTQAVAGPTPAPDTGDYATVEQFYGFMQNYSDPLVATLTKEP